MRDSTSPSADPRYRCAVLLALGVAASACGDAGRRPREPDRPLEIVVPTEVATLDPRFSTRAIDIKVTRLVHAGLMGLDPGSLEPTPLLAARWRFVDSATLAIELRAGIHFQGGKPLDPADVCATLAAFGDPSLSSPHRVLVRAIDECRAEPPLGVVLYLSEPRATLLSDLELPILRADQARSPPRPNGDLDALGPYRAASVTPGEIRLEPADTGVLPRANHAVVVRTIHDENARALRLLAGRSDIVPNALSPALLPAIAASGLNVNSRPGANVTYLLFQNDRAPFDRAEVRHAVARAIDRMSIANTLFAGHATIASFMLPKKHWAAPDSLEPEPFDPAGARAVLANLPPTTLLTSTDRFRVTIARAIAQMLGDAGLRVQVISLDLGVLVARLDAGDFALATLQMPELTEPNVLKWFFDPHGVPGEGGEGRNRARYRSAEAGALLDEASRVGDRQARQALYRKLAEVMRRDLPVVPLWHEDQIAVVSKRARSFELSAEGRWLSVASIP